MTANGDSTSTTQIKQELENNCELKTEEATTLENSKLKTQVKLEIDPTDYEERFEMYAAGLVADELPKELLEDFLQFLKQPIGVIFGEKKV